MLDLKQKMEALISQWELAAPKRIFGHHVYAANRKMFGWIQDEGIALTALPEEERELVKNKFGGFPYVHPGRVFKSWIIIPVQDEETFLQIIPHIRSSYEHAYEKSLEPKPVRKNRKRFGFDR